MLQFRGFMDFHRLDRALNLIAVRLWCNHALARIVTALLAAGAMFAAALLLVRIYASLWLPRIAEAGAALLLLAAALAVLRSARLRVTRLQAAAAADLALGLRERLATCVGARMAGRSGPFFDAQAQDAAAAADSAPFDSVAPLRLPDRARWLAIPAAVIIGVFVLHPNGPSAPRSFVAIAQTGGGGGGEALETVDMPFDSSDLGQRKPQPFPDERKPSVPPDEAAPAPSSRRFEALSDEERQRIFDTLGAERLNAARDAALSGGHTEDTNSPLDFALTTSAAALGSAPPAEGTAVSRWRYPAYQREISEYFK
jgi:signal transduction histidine kinase